MSLRQCVAILGDSLGTSRCGAAEGYAHILAQELQRHDVQVVNWSREDQTAMAWATEQLEELQAKIKEVSASGPELFVLVELGVQDRALLPGMIEEALGMLVRVVTSMDARPVLLEVVPDGVDRKVAEELGVGFVPAPQRVVEQWRDDPACPFTPQPEAHQDLADSAMTVLMSELRLTPLGEADQWSKFAQRKEKKKQGGKARLEKFRSGGGEPAPDIRESPFDGTWFHKDLIGMYGQVINGTTITSPDGQQTTLTAISDDMFWIMQDNARVHATLRAKQLKWDDGDVWYRDDFNEGTVGSLTQLKDAWENAERAAARTAEERSKHDFGPVRQAIGEEKERLDRARGQLQQDMATVGGRM